MKNLFWILLVGGLIGAFMTNPNEDDFKEFLTQKFTLEFKENKNFGGLLSLLASPASFIASLSLKKEDYKLCSIYTFKNLKGEEEKYVGLYTKFIKL